MEIHSDPTHHGVANAVCIERLGHVADEHAGQSSTPSDPGARGAT